LGRKSFYIYVASISILSLIAGIIFNLIWKEFNLSMHYGYAIIPYELKIIAAILLAALNCKIIY